MSFYVYVCDFTISRLLIKQCVTLISLSHIDLDLYNAISSLLG